MPNKIHYICARQIGKEKKIILHPTDEIALIHSKKIKEKYIWYITSQVSVNTFVEKNVFTTYDDALLAEDAIALVDPKAEKVYQPPAPPDDFNLPRD